MCKGTNLLRFIVLAVSIVSFSIASAIGTKAGEKKYTICPSSKFVIAEIDGIKFDVPQIVLDNGASIDHNRWLLRDQESLWNPVPEKCSEFSDIVPVIDAKMIVISRFNDAASQTLGLPHLKGNLIWIAGVDDSKCGWITADRVRPLDRLEQLDDGEFKNRLFPGVFKTSKRELIVSLKDAESKYKDRAIADCSHDIPDGLATNGTCTYAVKLQSGHCLMHRFTLVKSNNGDGSLLRNLPLRLEQQLTFVRRVMRCSSC